MKRKIIILQLVLGCFFMNTSLSQDFYTGVWRQGSGGTYLLAGMSWSEFNSKWSELAGKNLRLINIKTYSGSRGRLFTGIWSGGSDGYALTPPGLDWTEFNNFWNDYSKKGQRLINVETYVDGGKLYFLGVFRAGNDGYALTPLNLDWAEFNKFWDDNSKKGLRLINIESYMNEGKRYFLGVFRAGSGGYILSPYGKDWNQFKSYWSEQARNNQRLIDIESFTEGGKRIYLGAWREGSDGHYLWGGVDFESLNSKFAENNTTNLRLVDLETYDISSVAGCLNDVLMPRDDYNYEILAGPQHCEGQPGTCPSSPSSTSKVIYSWPNVKIEGKFYVRNSVLFDANDQIFTLPFKAPSSEMGHNAWLYSDGTWHHALDYWRSGSKTFEVCAAAPGKVIHIGWDDWSGGTIVMSHDADGKKDVYRTVYMHLQNGPDNDCEKSWSVSVADANFKSTTEKTNYKDYLASTGCPLEKNKRDPKSENWGTNSKKIDMSLLGKTISAGQVIGWSGNTGPGGCGCIKDGAGQNTHLHIFFAHKDPNDNRWYFIDPYGIYSHPDHYPKAVDGANNTACARYPITWKGGSPKYAQ